MVELLSKNQCCICNSLKDLEFKYLSNGFYYHNECYSALLDKKEKLEQAIKAKYNEIQEILGSNTESKKEIIRVKSVLNLKYIFGFKSQIEKIKHLESTIENNDSVHKQFLIKINNLQLEKEAIQNGLSIVYDFWPSRPPDWKERSSKLKDKREKCENCMKKDSWKTTLQAHHIVHVKNGGDHTEKNLKLLCTDCHQKQHNHDIHNNNLEEGHTSEFEKKLALITEALKEGFDIKFGYTKGNGSKSTRQIKPIEIEKDKFQKRTTCIKGFCHLRNANRVFAVKRMRNIKIIRETETSKAG